MRAEHDGITLLASGTGFVTIQPHLYAKGKLTYDPETDFIPVAGYGRHSEALMVNPSLPTKSVAELIALAKQKPGGLTSAPPASARRCTPRCWSWKAWPASR